jgi:monoamine oxidase
VDDQGALPSPSRFWAEAGLSGAVASDAGIVRVCADNSPPAGFSGVLVGFIEEAQAVQVAGLAGRERRAAVLSDLTRYFGEAARRPLEYREHDWGADEFSRGADGGYWAQGVWTSYGAALCRPVAPLHWAGTETSPVWNGKMEGAVLSGERAAKSSRRFETKGRSRCGPEGCRISWLRPAANARSRPGRPARRPRSPPRHKGRSRPG